MALEIYLVGNKTLKNCERKKNDTKFYCKHGDSEFLVTGDNFSYSAIELKKDKTLKAHDVDWIDDNGDPLYYPDLSSSEIFDPSTDDKYSGDVLNIKDISYNISKDLLEGDKIDFPIEEEVRSLYLKKKKKIADSLKKKKFIIENDEGKKVSCFKSNNLKCQIMKCKSDLHEERLLLMGSNPNTSSFEVLDLKGNQLSKNSFNAKRVYSSDGNLLIEKQSSPNFSKTVPAHFRKNSNTFMKLVNNKISSNINFAFNSCGDVYKDRLQKIKHHANEVKNSADMVQYIDIINNEVASNLVNRQSLGDDKCISSGVYYSKEAYKQIKEINVKNEGEVVDLKKANELFESMKNMDSIEWNYTRDGCFARAHLMARELERKGVKVGKIWARGDLSAVLDGQKESWFYHVAPVIYVKNKSGDVEEFVIDPALGKRPLSKKDWLKKMNVDIKSVNKRPYPLADNSKFYGQNVFAITGVGPYDPELRIGLTEEQKVDRANFKMEKFFMGDY